MLDKVDFPLTTSQISEFILDKGYTTYFRLQETLSELTDSELLKIETTHNRTLYRLTETGADTIHFFSNKISPEIRAEIDDFLKEKQYDLKEEVAVKSDYYLKTDHQFEVQCQIVENGSSLIDMRITVPTEKEAKAIVNNWNLKNQEIYALAEQIKKDFYGNRIVMFAPLYLSNYCVNGCVYCPYHAKNKHISRKKLTQEDPKRSDCTPGYGA